MSKLVIFDWGGVIMHKHPVDNSDKDAIIRTIQSFNGNLSDDEAWKIYIKTLRNENGVIISLLDDYKSKRAWVERIRQEGNLITTYEEFVSRWILEYSKVGCYEELINYIHSLKGKCKIGLLSDLIFCCEPALDKQVDLSSFDYVWLSYIMHMRKNTVDIFKTVQKDAGVNPEDILLIDDTEVNINNAKECGWNTCQAQGFEFDKIKSSVDSFLELQATRK